MIEQATTRFEVSKDELLCRSELERTRLELEIGRLKRRQSELEERVHRLNRIYGMAPVAFLTLSSDGRITEMNKAAMGLLPRGTKVKLPAQFSPFVAEVPFEDTTRRIRAGGSGQGYLRDRQRTRRRDENFNRTADPPNRAGENIQGRV